MKRLSVLILLTLAVSGVASAQLLPSPRVNRSMTVMTNDDGGYLGVQTVAITNENATKFGLKEVQGVAIDRVLDNSPAAAAGLQSGDVVIKFDGEEVKSMAKLSRLITEVAPDQKAKITILRDGNQREITVTMGKRPPMEFGQTGIINAIPEVPEMPRMKEFKLDDDFFKNLPKGQFPTDSNLVFNFSPSRKIGVVADALTIQLGEHFGVADGKGLLVKEVRADSPAGKAGLKAGDVVVQIDGKAVATVDEMVKAINAKKEGDVEVTFVRDKNRQTIKVTPEGTTERDIPTVFQVSPGSAGIRQTFTLPTLPPVVL